MFMVTPNTDIKIFSGGNCNEVMNKLKEFLQDNISITVLELLQSECVAKNQNLFHFCITLFYEKKG